MDDGLVLTNARAYDYCKAVLILVVVDDGLVPHKDLLMCVLSQSLNPYCSGRWSRTEAKKIKKEHKLAVLILIVVEDGLVHLDADDVKTERTGLNPYCSGRWSRTILIFVDNLKHLSKCLNCLI